MKRLLQWWRRRKQASSEVLTPASVVAYLNLGCGRCFHAHWCNVDMVPSDPSILRHDLRQPLPFGDGQFRAVYHSHVLEHLPRGEAPRFLSECFRVLRPGGILRVVVPDLEGITRLYLQNLEGALAGDEGAARRHEWMTLELLDQMVRDQSGGEMLLYWRRNPMPAETFVISRVGREVRDVLAQLRRPEGPPPAPRPPKTYAEAGRFRAGGEVHKWMYDQWSLGRLLESVGFTEVAVCAARESRIADFHRYGLDLEEDGSVRKPDSLFMEGIKPV